MLPRLPTFDKRVLTEIQPEYIQNEISENKGVFLDDFFKEDLVHQGSFTFLMRTLFHDNRTLPAPISEGDPNDTPQETENYVKFDFMPYFSEHLDVNESSSEEQPVSTYS